MKLTYKLTGLLVAGNCLVLAGYGFLAHQREAERFRRAIERDTYLAGVTLLGTVEVTWREHGRDAALKLIARASDRQKDMQFHWLTAAALTRAPLSPEERETLARSGYVHARSREHHFAYVAFQPPTPEPPGALQITKHIAGDVAYLRATKRRLLVTTGISIAVSGLIALALGATLVGRPIQALVRRVEAVGGGNLSGRLALGRSDELGTLARALDQMAADLQAAQAEAKAETAERLATLRQLRHAERLATVGRLGAGLAHELGTPLNVVLARAKLIERQAEDPEKSRAHAAIVREQTQKMTRIIRQLLDFARRGEPNKARARLDALGRQSLELLQPLAHKQGVRLVGPEEGAPEAWSEVDPNQLEQVITNLVMNAIHASPPNGEVRVEVAPVRVSPPHDPHEPTDHWRLGVLDEGPGIPPELRERIFEPFFTTKDVGEGTGLGLTVVHGIVAEHDGWLEVHDRPDGGCRIDVFLPAVEAPAPVEARA